MVHTLQQEEDVLEFIMSSLKPVVVHYWSPLMGPESPLMPLFLEAEENRGNEVEFVIVDSGFIHPQHYPDEMPLTVLYREGEEVETAPFHPDEIQALIERA
ncbi:hypothetical protein BDV38DRAFT_280685 [Aspergillus pseudotamarii]|uniref:Thioredoxin domain-containing protein n=1 Tax=Aspergillus pseudotamarii TaxID=132259 RepID=A0A5N6SYL2_ASPPS|nr:uncharacterized protein BDV38DRAFT_280685 [Aspergillus pseudotamarii]KAE8139768.1 hypothetical protein BDV38DRAFT_280685 [Aspergillus pseudotamarii]